ncbi:MAG: tRNA (N6-isopentenyl adenosine(37)-C2)-methylthiotransferase MiaB [Leptospirillum sp.]
MIGKDSTTPKEGKTFFIRTFGCQMNVHDSERMSGLMSEAGYTPVSEPSDASVILVNTCTVRDKADQKALSDIGRLRSVAEDGHSRHLVITGCMAEREGKELFRMVPDVDLVMGPSQIRNLIPLLEKVEKGSHRVMGRDLPPAPPTTPPATRPPGIMAYVTIQEGCDKSCAYCVVPATRGPEISRTIADIKKEVEQLVKDGYREITLLGQNVNAFGIKEGTSLANLMRSLDEVDGLSRIRFTTSHPRDMSLDLIRAMKDVKKVMPHFHLPMQSGSDSVLARMNRGYTRREFAGWIDLLRREIPGIAITTDLIVGYVGETQEEFEETLSAVEEFSFDGAFSFIYSPRPSTPAEKLEGTPPREVSVERLNRLQKRIEELVHEKNSAHIGQIIEILVDRSDPETGAVFGRAPWFQNVRAQPSFTWEGSSVRELLPSQGSIARVRVTETTRSGFKGEWVTELMAGLSSP